MPEIKLNKLEVALWRVRNETSPAVVCAAPGKVERTRHLRKYSAGDLHEKSFVFRGPQGKLKLRAQNLMIFLQIAEGVDDQTWMHHLQAHDYSRWIQESIKDAELAQSLRSIEDAQPSPEESRRAVAEVVRSRYTAPE